MYPVYQSAFLKALGWSLIDSLWQTGMLWFLYITITGNGKRFSSSFRYSLGLIAVFLGSVGFFIGILSNYQDPARTFSLFGKAAFLSDFMPLFSASYLVVGTFYAARLVYTFNSNKNLLRDVKPAGIDATNLIEQLSQITAVSRTIKVWCSDKIYTPLTTGFLKPVILLPVAAFTQLSKKQIEALIVHEFFHIKRNDYLVNLLTLFAEAFLFFNPFARLLLKNIKHERENCCDDEVIRLGYDRWEYAHALFTLGKNSQQNFRFALAATGNAKHLLLARVKRVLNTGATGYALKKPLAIFFFSLLVAGSITEPVYETAKASALKREVPPVSQILLPASPLPARGERISNKANRRDPAKRPGWVTEKSILTKAKPKTPIPPPPPVTVESPSSGGENHIFYVSSNVEVIDFSMVEAPISISQKPAGYFPSQPFVPSSTFYFPDHETSIAIDGKKTIRL